jgi:2-polyprenyl-3-methyl-5-hydroxy-6-metoxy-1,4-benzoquinol methylase/DNA-directed RNA polymerase subunit M/transcription elongation factor TFIIS
MPGCDPQRDGETLHRNEKLAASEPGHAKSRNASSFLKQRAGLMSANISASCPICQASDVSMRFKVSRSDLIDRPEYLVRSCDACGHHWADGTSTRQMFSEIYSKYFYGTGQQSVPHNPDGSLKPDAERFSALINSRRRARGLNAMGLKGQLLDVGCGVGYFVLAAQTYFEAEGIEIEEAAVQKAAAIGVRVTQGDVLSSERVVPRQFDVVTLWDVFSGFEQPRQAASRLLDCVAGSGALVLTVPDAGSRIARLTGRRWPLMIPPGNMHFYTEQSVRTLFSGHEVASVTVVRETKRVSIDFLAHKMLRALDLHRIAKWRRPIPKNWNLSVNLGDIMTVIIKKSAPGSQ